MDDFLQSTSSFSFNDVVDQDENNARLGQVEAPEDLCGERSKKSKKKKVKKDEAKDHDLPATKTATKSEDKIANEDLVEDDEVWQAQDDPYQLPGEDVGEDNQDDNDELPSKRAMQRALRGWTRRSGGWKHRKKPAAAGKSPAQGRGKMLGLIGGYSQSDFHCSGPSPMADV